MVQLVLERGLSLAESLFNQITKTNRTYKTLAGQALPLALLYLIPEDRF